MFTGSSITSFVSDQPATEVQTQNGALSVTAEHSQDHETFDASQSEPLEATSVPIGSLHIIIIRLLITTQSQRIDKNGR